MPRPMSCFLTIDQVRRRQKTVTRRHVDSWLKLQQGDLLPLIEKGQGLKRGEKQVLITEVEVVSVWVEPLLDGLSPAEVEREGFGAVHPAEFAAFWAAAHGYGSLLRNERFRASPAPWLTPPPRRLAVIRRALAGVKCRRIEWRYLDEVDIIA